MHDDASGVLTFVPLLVIDTGWWNVLRSQDVLSSRDLSCLCDLLAASNECTVALTIPDGCKGPAFLEETYLLTAEYRFLMFNHFVVKFDL